MGGGKLCHSRRWRQCQQCGSVVREGASKPCSFVILSYELCSELPHRILWGWNVIAEGDAYLCKPLPLSLWVLGLSPSCFIESGLVLWSCNKPRGQCKRWLWSSPPPHSRHPMCREGQRGLHTEHLSRQVHHASFAVCESLKANGGDQNL